MLVAHFADFSKGSGARRYSDESPVEMVFSRASFFGAGRAKFVEKHGDLSIFAKRVLRRTPALAYKIVWFCLVPRLKRFSPRA
jgi:hypothetical protein